MKSAIFALAMVAGTTFAQNAKWGQCGGVGWTGSKECVSGTTCQYQNDWYSQCLTGEGPSTRRTHTRTIHVTSTTAIATHTHGVTSTVVSATHTHTSYSSTAPVSTYKPASTSQTSAPAPSSSTAPSSGGVKYGGVNIAGFDFGCSTDGTCTTSSVDPPGTLGIAQMKHFASDNGLNAFRLPVGWQYLVNNNVGGTLDSTNFANYDTLVQGCVDSGAELCIVDIHNYARWNGAIIGQGGPTNAQFASLWSQIATKYKSNSKVAFGIMNEPHDVEITAWATTVQAAVTAIRQAGATSNLILLPGNSYTSAAGFISNGSGAALMTVVNLDGSTTNLVFDVHAYLDSDSSGTHASCTTNNVDVFSTLASYLRANKRMAILTETGGGSSDSSCETSVCEELSYLNENSDVFLGWTAWAAGMFDTSYTLSLTPMQSGSTWTDQPLLKQCIAGMFKG